VSDLKRYVALQAKLFGFLDQQDEGTLQAIADGTLQLSLVGADETPRTAAADVLKSPSSDPLQVAHDLSKLVSQSDRRLYLNAAKLKVTGLKRVAGALGMKGYSNYRRENLVELLSALDSDLSDASPPEHATPPRTPPAPVEDPSKLTQQAVSRTMPVSGDSGKPAADAVAVASHLRELDTEEEGAGYLDAQHLDKDGLLAVAAELQLTRVTRLSQKELRKRVLYQAIGARRKFAGLRKW
jgi:hypothetical protein